MSSSTVRAMTSNERIEMNPAPAHPYLFPVEIESLIPGLKVMVRTTSSSLSDYPEWNLDDHNVVSDGACS